MSDPRSDPADPRTARASPALRIGGTVCLLVAVAAAGALAAGELGARVPGCGLESPCERAAASAWGSVPGIGWPVAFLGLAWFGGLLAAWLRRGRLDGTILRLLSLAGGAVSLVYLGRIVGAGPWCPYCLAAHAGHLGFLAIAHRRALPGVGSRPGASAAGLATALGTALALSVGLGLARGAGQAARERAEEDELERSLDALAVSDPIDAAAEGALAALEGPHRLGPPDARIRLVAFTDYQCPDCRRFEPRLAAAVDAAADVSLSIRHLPLGAACNPAVRERGEDPHPRACDAARAAEAAALVGGEAAFWRTHRWLFAQDPLPPADRIVARAPELGLDPAAFAAALAGPEAGAQVDADVRQALRLGLASTPVLFVNGRELRGLSVPGALERALAAARAAPAAEPPPPPDAVGRLVDDWHHTPRSAGVAAPVVVFGDCEDPYTRELAAHLRALGQPFVFRHFPFDRACNPHVPRTGHPRACFAARLVEAARNEGGDALREKLLTWLLQEPPDRWSEERITALLSEDPRTEPERVFSARSSERVTARLREDQDAARALGIERVPFLFIGGRHVPRWRDTGEGGLAALLRASEGSR